MNLFPKQILALAKTAGLEDADREAVLRFAYAIEKAERQGCVQTLNNLFKVLPTENMETVSECIFAIESR